MTVLAAVLLGAVAGALWPASAPSRLRSLRDAGQPARGVGPGSRVAAGLARLRAAVTFGGGRATTHRAMVVELCGALAAELRSGAAPRESLAAAAQGWPSLAPLASSARSVHVDVPDLLAAAARHPGAEGLRALALCWQVSEHSGAGLAPAVSRLAESLRDDEQLRREVAAQLAGPRATAGLLAMLPLLGLAMGSALGADPLGLLLGTPLGLGLLGSGLGLEVLGLRWAARIAGRVTAG